MNKPVIKRVLIAETATSERKRRGIHESDQRNNLNFFGNELHAAGLCCIEVVGGAMALKVVAHVKGELETTMGHPSTDLRRQFEGPEGHADYRPQRQKDATVGISNNKGGWDQSPISLETAGPGSTKVKIRVGTFGDEEVSMTINRKIASNLGIK
jgi:hypothetical protein